MKNKSTITILVACIAILSAIAAAMGIFSSGGPGTYVYESIRGKEVMIYGKGLYQHMSAEVAPQGIAQDYVTLFVGIPVLLLSFFLARKGSLAGKYLLAGTLGYFLVTYLFYTVMGMYNQLFLVYVALMGCAFFAFVLTLFSFDTSTLAGQFDNSTPVKSIGSFLLFNACAIALLWLSIVVPPLLDGTVVPLQAEHYTTLIVQGLDLGILLPSAFVTGILLVQKRPMGYLLAPVYFVFLSLLMMALMAKVLAMQSLGYNVTPVIFIIPSFAIASLLCTVLLLKHCSPLTTKVYGQLSR